MTQVIQSKGEPFILFTNMEDYLNAEQFSGNSFLRVADMPTAIRIMADHPEVRERVREGYLDFNTTESAGLRKGDGLLGILNPKPVYEVWHSIGSFKGWHGRGELGRYLGPHPTAPPYPEAIRRFGYHELSPDWRLMERNFNERRGNFEKAFGQKARNEYSQTVYLEADTIEDLAIEFGDLKHAIISHEWTGVGKGDRYGVKNVLRIHLDDVRRGDVPETGTPHSIYVNVEKDKPFLTGTNFANPPARLDYDDFMRDDRILMLAGSPDNRELLAKSLFDPEQDGGEGLNWIENRVDYYPYVYDGDKLKYPHPGINLFPSPQMDLIMPGLIREIDCLYGGTREKSDRGELNSPFFQGNLMRLGSGSNGLGGSIYNSQSRLLAVREEVADSDSERNSLEKLV